MGAKLKYAAAAAAAAVVIAAAAFVYLWQARAGSGPLAYIPEPDETAPYILLETKGRNYPKVLSSLLTDGIYAHLKSDTPSGAVLAAAAMAEDAAVLLERGADGAASVCCAARFTAEETKLLQKGALPAPLDAAFGTESAEGRGGVFAVRSESLSEPFYYTVRGTHTLIAADQRTLHKMTSLENGGGLKDKKWTQEPQWPAHIEISDGSELTKRAKENFALTLEAAWRGPQSEGQPGEARWAFVNLGAAARAYMTASLEAKSWDVSGCVLPQPLLLSAGVNLPALKGSPSEWPFPLSRAGIFAESLGLADAQIREILAGRTVISLGGQNKILWFSLPGFLAEFSGRPELMRALVSAFWDNLFLGAEPESVAGFDFGGAASVPFSVIGAGRGGTAVLGLASPQSLASGETLSQFLSKDEKAVGWMLADLPRIGKALSEMTRMSTFLEEEEDEDFYGGTEDYGGGYPWGGTQSDPEPLQPEISISPFDQEIADSFGGVLQRLGRVMIVWEKPLSGRINWYNHEK